MKELTYKNMKYERLKGCLEEALNAGNQYQQTRLEGALDLLRLRLNQAFEENE